MSVNVCNGLPAYEKKERKNKIKLIRLPFVVWFYATATFRVVSEKYKNTNKKEKRKCRIDTAVVANYCCCCYTHSWGKIRIPDGDFRSRLPKGPLWSRYTLQSDDMRWWKYRHIFGWPRKMTLYIVIYVIPRASQRRFSWLFFTHVQCTRELESHKRKDLNHSSFNYYIYINNKPNQQTGINVLCA